MPLNNFGRVDSNVYRSAQPDQRGMLLLRDALGVQVVLKLNTTEEAEEPTLPDLDIWHVTLGLRAPSDGVTRELVEQIRLRQVEGVGLLIHCTFGRDRTGFVCAAYELLVLQRSLDEVLATRAAYGGDNEWARIANHSFTEALERLAAARDALS